MRKIHFTFILLIFLISTARLFALAGEAEVWLQRVGSQSDQVAVGDILTLDLMIDTNGERITGVSFFMTVDPTIFKPIYYKDDQNVFQPRTFIRNSPPVVNTTHFDVWGADPMLNGIAGFQLDYEHQTPVAVDGVRPSASGRGVVATLKLQVIGLPENPDQPVYIGYDYQDFHHRITTYFLADAPGTRQKFARRDGLSFFVSGFKIYPTIPDTSITPGTTMNMNLGKYVVASKDFPVLFTNKTIQGIDNTTLSITDSIITLTSTADAHGIIEANIIADQQGTTEIDSQVVHFGVNNKTTFKAGINKTVTFNEDEQFTVPKTNLIEDLDDPLSSIKSSYVGQNIVISSNNENFIFTASPNWFGTENVTFSVFDEIMEFFDDSTSSSFNINVLPVNDAPILDFSSIDSLQISYFTPQTITMQKGVYVFDPDDDVFTWSVLSDNDKVTAQFTDNKLTIKCNDADYSGYANLTITVKDDDEASDTKVLTVKVDENVYPVKVRADFPNVVLYPDTTFKVNLNNYVDYPQELRSSLIWSFEVRNVVTKVIDTNVTVIYNPLTQTVEFAAQEGHQAQNEIVVTVIANVNNQDTLTRSFIVLNARELSIFTFPSVQLVKDEEKVVLDLDNYVQDPNDSPNQITWSYTGGESLESVSINPATHELTLKSNDTFLGTGQITLTARNTRGDTKSQSLTFTVVDVELYPVFRYSLPDTTYLKDMAHQYVDLDNYILNPDDITWTIQYDNNYLSITKDDENFVNVYAKSLTGKTAVIFTARNSLGYVKNDTVIFTVYKVGQPGWRAIPSIEFNSNEIYNDLNLLDFCVDPSGGGLEFTFQCSEPDLKVSVDSAFVVTLTPTNGFSGFATLFFLARNVNGAKVSNLIDVTVKDVSSLSVFYNSIMPQQVNFIVNADTNVVSVDYNFTAEDKVQVLSFQPLDVIGDQKIWSASYTFDENGQFELVVTLTRSNGIITRDSLKLVTQLAKQNGGQFFSMDNKLAVAFPSSEFTGQRFYMLEERFGRRNKIFKVFSNALSSEKLIITVPQKNRANTNFSFYKLVENERIPIKTVITESGEFMANINTSDHFVFDVSDSPADVQKIATKTVVCYPNPFNSSTKINFWVEQETDVTVSVYNMLGQRVFVRENVGCELGTNHLNWHGVNDFGQPVASGVYFVSVVSKSVVYHVQKIVLLK